MTIWHRVLDFGVWLADFDLVQSIKLISYDAIHSDKSLTLFACLRGETNLTLRPSLWYSYGNTSIMHWFYVHHIIWRPYFHMIFIWDQRDDNYD